MFYNSTPPPDRAEELFKVKYLYFFTNCSRFYGFGLFIDTITNL